MTGKSKLRKDNPLFVKNKKVNSLTGFLANELGLQAQQPSSGLIAGDQPINQIAQLLGYSSSANFCYAFKQWTALSPKVYREEVRYR
ncbi:MAG: AraC family transcriptional regulator [Pseudomonadales bacterium]|nr:AraC family transcriptional regulator [Pseudomonadales bacterium]